MTIGIKDTVRNAMLNAIRDAIDVGAPGKVRFYSGTRPATGGAATTQLAELALSNPSAPNASSGMMTFSAITQDSSADANGVASWFRILTSANVAIVDGSCTAIGGGGDCEMITTTIAVGQPVQMASLTISAGNP